MKDSELKVAFRDIARGFSEPRAFGFPVFLKHISQVDSAELEDRLSLYEEEALKSGLPTRKDRESYLFQIKQWTRADEDKIRDYQADIDNNRKMMRHLFKITEKKALERKIEEAQKTLLEMKYKKNELIGRTVESAAEQKVNDLLIFSSFYKDKELKQRLYSEDEFDEISESQLREMYRAFNEVSKKISEEAIKKIVLSPFFSIYYSFLDSPIDMYNKSALELTVVQANMFVYAKIAKNLLEKHQDAPEHIKKDFDELINYDDSKNKADKIMDKAPEHENGGTFIVGKKKDLEYMGVNNSNSRAAKIARAIKQKGGSLNMDEMKSLNV